MPETPNPEELIKWVGWLLSLVLGLIGIGVTFSVLYIRIRHAEKLAQRKERHDAIDNALRLLTDFEDKSLDYWTAKDSKYTKAHIITAQQRLSFSIKQRRPRKLSATPDLSGTVLPLCPIPNSASKSAPSFNSVKLKASACAALLA